MGAEKDKILKYLEKQVELKLNAVKALDIPIISDAGKVEVERERLKISTEMYELQRHIEVIKLL